MSEQAHRPREKMFLMVVHIFCAYLAQYSAKHFNLYIIRKKCTFFTREAVNLLIIKIVRHLYDSEVYLSLLAAAQAFDPRGPLRGPCKAILGRWTWDQSLICHACNSFECYGDGLLMFNSREEQRPP